MQRLTYGHKPWLLQRPCQPYVRINSRFHVCTSLAPRPMTVVVDLGTRLHVRMHTMASYTVRNGQQPGRAENSFIDQGELVAMKTLSDCKAPRYGKGQFCDKMTANT